MESLAPVYWLTGLSGAGKSTIADAFIGHLKAAGIPCVSLDGDVLRTGLCSDLGFSSTDRRENIRRTAEVARLFSRNGITAVCSLISPERSQREMARGIVGEPFVEVFIDCTLAECIRRDPKGLYERAIAGTIPNFTGISAPYEAPVHPEVQLNTEVVSVSDAEARLWELHP
jgi:adenylyl-sulfate kinase